MNAKVKAGLKQAGYGALLACFYLPVVSIFGRLFFTEKITAKIISFLNSGVFQSTLSFSTREAVLSSLISLAVAFFGAYFLGRFNFYGKSWLKSLLVLPFMLPGILVVLGLVAVYGNNGLLNEMLAHFGCHWRYTGLYGFWGVVLAHVLYNFPFCLRLLGESWERINPVLREASFSLGGNRLKTWFAVTFPLLLPTVFYLLAVVFLYSFLSFTIVLVFGGYLYKTFEVLIYIEYNNKLHFETAALIASLQTVLLAVALGMQLPAGRKARNQAKPVGDLPRLRRRTYPLQTLFFSLYLLWLTVFLISPFLTVFWRSLNNGRDGLFTLQNYVRLFGEDFRFTVGASFPAVALNSLWLAGIVAVISVSLAYPIARVRRRQPWGAADILFQLPLGISFMTYSFGLINLWGDSLNQWLLVGWAQIFLSFPLIYSILRVACRDLQEPLLESAALLGAGPVKTFLTVELPLMKKPLKSALAYAAAISLGDLAAVLTLGEGELATFSVAIYRLIGHYHFGAATALGSIFILLALGLFLVLDYGLTGPGVIHDGE